MIIKDHYVNIFTDLPIMYPPKFHMSSDVKLYIDTLLWPKETLEITRFWFMGENSKFSLKRSERGIWENQFISIRSIIQSSTIILQRPRPLTLCTYTGTEHITFFRPQRHSYKTKSQFSVLTTSSPSSTSLIDGVAGVLIFELSSTSES